MGLGTAMNTKLHALAMGSLAGLIGAALTLGCVGGLGTGPGGILGLFFSVGLGAGGAWLAADLVSRRVQVCLASLETPARSERTRHELLIGWPGLDREIDGLRQTVLESEQTRKELTQLEDLARSLWTSADASGEGSTRSREGRKGFRELLEEFRRNSGRIAQGSGKLGEATDRMATSASGQMEAVSKTTTTVEALSDRIDRISQNAEDAAEATERARQEARRGLEQIQEIISGMDRLRTHVETNARKAKRLGDRSVEIGSIVEMISGISSRTDMLALNATIESVRAGEHGRGFAVVAEEIRKLAERTAAATREIGALVETIQADAHESVRALADEQTEMEQEAQRVREAGSALDRISKVAERSAKLVEEISHSANDQVVVTQELVQAMQRISEASRLILNETTNARKDAKDLSQRCRHLQRLTGLDVEEESNSRDDLPTVMGKTTNGRSPRSLAVEKAR